MAERLKHKRGEEIANVEMLWVEQNWRVLLHNDEITPFKFVEQLLQTIFKLPPEVAYDITLRAHTHGVALVCVCPHSESMKLVGKAIFMARMAGFPLMLTCEPDT